MKIHLISFASSNLSRTLERIRNEAIESNFFDVIQTFTELDIPEFMDRHKDFIISNGRGYGYWLWKSYITKKYLSTLEDNDILIYLDAGFKINIKGENRLKEYINMCINSEFKNVSFQYNQYKEYQYTKSDLFKHIDLNDEDINSGQLMGGAFILQKCSNTVDLIDKWYETGCNYNLINDSPSVIKNHNGFIDHRHDQSIFSCLRKKYGTYSIINECDLDCGGFSNIHLFENRLNDKPFWVLRLKY